MREAARLATWSSLASLARIPRPPRRDLTAPRDLRAAREPRDLRATLTLARPPRHDLATCANHPRKREKAAGEAALFSDEWSEEKSLERLEE